MEKSKHINIPVFIPHLGCPNQCVFCDQRTISGTARFDESDVRRIIDDAVSSSAGAEREIAFFGGSFTGIDRGLMIRLLDLAEEYVAEGDACGIRMSTRPDYIDGEIISILSRYTVSEVELGIQSMSDRVLALSKRGHTADDTRRAAASLTAAGIGVCGQMMIGLPGSTLSDETDTAREICGMGCSDARVYPTLVFKGTQLDEMLRRGEYVSLTVDEAADRMACVLDIFDRRGVRCLRSGLCDSENLHDSSTFSAGPNHPSIGEIAMGRIFYKRIAEALSGVAIPDGASLTVECPRGAVSKVTGHKGENRERIFREFGIKSLKAIENDRLLGYNIKVLFS
ncbi:MAG: radical SAM protein [Clostridia bacterium]|nr:radical SAM protein [Clostridia bacterium]